jgi:hypothetical protein
LNANSLVWSSSLTAVVLLGVGSGAVPGEPDEGSGEGGTVVPLFGVGVDAVEMGIAGLG